MELFAFKCSSKPVFKVVASLIKLWFGNELVFLWFFFFVHSFDIKLLKKIIMATFSSFNKKNKQTIQIKKQGLNICKKYQTFQKKNMIILTAYFCNHGTFIIWLQIPQTTPQIMFAMSTGCILKISFNSMFWSLITFVFKQCKTSLVRFIKFCPNNIFEGIYHWARYFK